MSTLTSRTVADSYPELIKVDAAYKDPFTFRQVEDGLGNPFPLKFTQEYVYVTGSLLLANALTQAYPINSTWNGQTAAISVASALVSSSPSTGALTVAGGVGIGSNLYVGGNVNVLGASTFTGNSQFVGNVNIDGQLTLKGNIAVGDANTDTISFTADVTSNFLPDVTETYDLGSSGKSWQNVFSKSLTSKTIDISERATFSPVSGVATVTISPTNLTIAPAGTTSNLNNITIGATTPRGGSFTSITQTDLAGSVALSSTVESTSTITGSLKTAGGAGIAKNLYVGGTLNVGSTGSNNVTFSPPVNVNNVSTFTNTLTINPPNTTTSALRIANNNVDAVTVDANGQLNVLKTSVHTGKSTFNGVTEVNNVLQQVNAGSTSTFAGPVTLNNTGASSLVVNGASTLRSFVAKDAAGTTDVLTFNNTTNTLSHANEILSGTFNVVSNTSATSTNYPYGVSVNSTGALTAVGNATLAAGYISTTNGSIILAGTCSTIEPATASTKLLRIRPAISSATDIINVDFATKATTVIGTLALSPTTGGSVSTSILPTTDNAVDLGSSALRWRDLNVSRNLNLGGLITATSTGEHTFTGNLRINGNLFTVGSQTTTGGQLTVSSASKELRVNVAANDTATSKVVQNLSASAIDGGLFINATLPLKVKNTIAVADAATETITHSFNVPLAGITAIRTDTNADISSLFTFVNNTNTSATVTWAAGATAALGAAGAVGGILFTLTPQSSYGFYGLNGSVATSGTPATFTHNLLTTAISVVVTNDQTGAVIPATSYTVTTPSNSTATITWAATITPSAPGSLRIKITPSANVQQSSSVTYATPATSTSTPPIPEPQFLSSDNFGLASGKSYFINNTRVLNATSLGDTVVSSKLTSVGTITSGVWQGTNITGTQGGTGVANVGKKITISGDFSTTATSNLTTCSLALTANTIVTLPTTGTLATLSNAETLTNKTLGAVGSVNITIPAGALSSDLAVADGGTGRSTLAANGVLFGAGTSAINSTSVGTDKQILISSAGTPTFTTISPVITLTGDVTGTGTMTDLGNVTINTTVGADKVELGADTTGSYVESLALAGSGLTIANAAPGADGAQYTITSSATANNNSSTIVLRDASGNFSASQITATSFVGNASTASSAAQWTTARTLTLSGDISGTVSINGANDATMSNTAIVAGSIVNADINASANIADTKLAQIVTANKVANSATTALSCTGITDPTSNSLKNSIVTRDANGSVTVNQLVALQGIIGTASDVLDGVSTQKVKVSGYNSSGQAVTSEQTEIVFSSNSNCNVWVSPDSTGTKTNVQVSVPSVTTYINDFNDANFLVSDDVSGGRIKFKLDSLSSASSSNSGNQPRALIVADTNQTLMGYTNASPLSGTPGTLTSYPFTTWDAVPKAFEIKLAGTLSTDAPVTAYIPFYQ